MEFSQIRPHLSYIGKFAVNVAISAGTGYAYGKLFRADAVLAAKAFVISSLAQKVFHMTAMALFGDENGPRSRVINSFTVATMNVASIVAFRHLNLIALPGTIFFTINAIFLTSLVLFNDLWVQQIRNRLVNETQAIG